MKKSLEGIDLFGNIFLSICCVLKKIGGELMIFVFASCWEVTWEFCITSWNSAPITGGFDFKESSWMDMIFSWKIYMDICDM